MSILMPGYAAPEQYGYVAAFRPYTDILSLGVTLCHAWIGHPLPPWAHPAAHTGDTQRSRAFVLQDFLYAAARGGDWKDIATDLLGVDESSVADEAREHPVPYRLTARLPDVLQKPAS